jgi:hypothetical protein
MVATFLHKALRTHDCVLPDGRRVTVRRAVPSDLPRLGDLGPDRGIAWGLEVVAIDDHGSIVGLAVSADEVFVAPGWTALRSLLAHEVQAL